MFLESLLEFSRSSLLTVSEALGRLT